LCFPPLFGNGKPAASVFMQRSSLFRYRNNHCHCRTSMGIMGRSSHREFTCLGGLAECLTVTRPQQVSCWAKVQCSCK
jgi:hypothetical protein